MLCAIMTFCLVHDYPSLVLCEFHIHVMPFLSYEVHKQKESWIGDNKGSHKDKGMENEAMQFH
jgi:hypothetical protein